MNNNGVKGAVIRIGYHALEFGAIIRCTAYAAISVGGEQDDLMLATIFFYGTQLRVDGFLSLIVRRESGVSDGTEHPAHLLSCGFQMGLCGIR
jgi:hypothetical protein